MVVGSGTEEIVFRVVLDPSDLEKLGLVGPGVVAGAGVGGGGGGGVFPTQGQTLPGPGEEGMKVKQDPSFLSIFKPLAALNVIEKSLGGILKHSSIANSYLGAMGKMFGAAIDMLLLPLTPVFNLIMVGMAKLIQWLMSSGILDKLYVIFSKAAENISAMASWLQDIYHAIKDLNVGKLAKLGAEGAYGTLKNVKEDPVSAVVTAVLLTLGGRAVWGMGAKALGMVGLGAAARVGGGLVAGAAGGTGLLGRVAGPLGTLTAGLGAMQLGDWMGGKLSGSIPGSGQGEGGAIAGLIGKIPGGKGLVDAIVDKTGGFIFPQRHQQMKLEEEAKGLSSGQGISSGASLQNVGNTMTVTINIDAQDYDEQEIASRAVAEMEEVFVKNQGYAMSTRSF